jgi:apolipoprotein N-acyltransferase
MTAWWHGRLLWALAGAAAWVAMEMMRARVLGGFPWNILGASQYKMVPLIQIASVTGVYGISFLVVWTSLSFYSAAQQAFSHPTSRFAWQAEVFLPLLVVIGLFAWGEVRMKQADPTAAVLRVAVIQPSIPQDLIWDETANSNRFQQLLALSATALTNDVDLLVWPESGVPDFDDATYYAITNFVCAHHVSLIFDADDVRPKPNATSANDYDVFNAAFLAGPEDNIDFANVYHKQKLVMFGEYIPFVTWLPFIKWFTPITGGYTPGRSAVRFGLAGLNASASPLICYEDMFPQTARKAARSGADFLINLTNDGWFGRSAEQWQHETCAIFRAVENGIPLVRCCNNGISCWIDARGRQREIFRASDHSAYDQGTLVFDLPLEQPDPTFYTRHGDCFGWSCVAIALCLGGFKLVRRPKQLS